MTSGGGDHSAGTAGEAKVQHLAASLSPRAPLARALVTALAKLPEDRFATARDMSRALAGQHATYTAKTLRDYASGARVSADKTQMMRDIASRLSEEEIVALASYVQGLRP